MKISNVIIAGIAIAGLVYTFKDPYRKESFVDAVTPATKKIEKYGPSAENKIAQWQSKGIIKKIDPKIRRIYVSRIEWDKPSLTDAIKRDICRSAAVVMAKKNNDKNLRMDVYTEGTPSEPSVKLAKYSSATGYKEDRQKVDFGQMLK